MKILCERKIRDNNSTFIWLTTGLEKGARRLFRAYHKVQSGRKQSAGKSDFDSDLKNAKKSVRNFSIILFITWYKAHHRFWSTSVWKPH